MLSQSIYHSPLTTYHLPLTTYHLPLTTYHLPLTTYHLPLTTYHLPLTTYHLPFTIYRRATHARQERAQCTNSIPNPFSSCQGKPFGSLFRPCGWAMYSWLTM